LTCKPNIVIVSAVTKKTMRKVRVAPHVEFVCLEDQEGPFGLVLTYDTEGNLKYLNEVESKEDLQGVLNAVL
jgi:nitrate reductase NapAB chaperone NapD